MRVYVSVDMEGISGVTASRQVAADGPDYQRFRRLMTADVNAAVRGAAAAGATAVVVNDAHGGMTNILVEELDGTAVPVELISGSNKHLCQMEGVDGGFDAAFLVGYHAREGAGDATLNHTLLGRTVAEVRINGRPVGETGISAALAGAFGVPVVLVTGDAAVGREARDLLGPVETVAVKESSDRLAGRALLPAEAQRRIEAAAARALARRGELAPWVLPAPVEFQVDFKGTAEAHMGSLVPGAVRVGPKTLAVSGADVPSAFKVLWAALIIARATAGGVL